MSRQPRPKASEEEMQARPASELMRELARLGQETETDRLLDALQEQLKDWAPEDEDQDDRGEIIDRLNRELIAKSVFREDLDFGFHEESDDVRPIESEVRKGLDELRKLIEMGRPR